MEYVIIAIILIICSIIYLKLATKYNIVDNPNFRSSHTIPTIRGGGILFLIAVLCYFVYSNFEAPYFVLGLSAIAIISFLDDILTLSAKLRLPFQFFAIGLVLYQLQLFEMPLLVVALTAIVGVAFINVFNFMDGINGITGMYGIAVLGALFVLNQLEHLVYTNVLMYVLLSVLVFGYNNFRKKARMFAGDVGSISLALVIFYVGLAIGVELQAPVVLLLVAVYGVDGGLTILYRLSIREHIMEPHRHHIYQKLVDVLKWPHLKVSVVYMVLQMVIGGVVILSYGLSLWYQIMITIVVLLVLSIFYVFVFNKVKTVKSNS